MRTLLISLEKQYYEKILAGRKKYEFRRAFVKELTQTFIYVTASVAEIKLCVETAVPISGDGKSMHEYALKHLSEDLGDYFFNGKNRLYYPD